MCVIWNKLTSTPTIENAYTSHSFDSIKLSTPPFSSGSPMSSGAMYRTDPEPSVDVKPRASIILERPKSDTKGLSLSAINTFGYETKHENRSNERQTNSHP